MTKDQVQSIRKRFPILQREVNNHPLIFFDNAATTQKPKEVIARINDFYANENSNIHRGAHLLSHLATEAYEKARQTIASFINASNPREVIFTKGTTDAINLVASSFCQQFVKPGDQIVVSGMEHHANIVPWQMACQKHQASLKVIPINKAGELVWDEYLKLLNKKTKLVAVTHVSNALGTINPVKDIIREAHTQNIPVLIDGAQAMAHMAVDVQELDCDFYCFSGHKMYGPMGVGVLYGKEKWLEKMPPYQGGGEMIKDVSFERTTYNELPHKFEAGTPNVADVLGLEAASLFIGSVGHASVGTHETSLLNYALNELQKVDSIRFIGTAEKRTGVISFVFEDIHPYDTGVILDKMGIALRTGHHCAQPLMDFFNVPGTVRVSMAVYNTTEEIDTLVSALDQVRKMFS